LTDCSSILETVDAYALGAVDSDEAAAVERHVADCLDCWEELSRARETAGLVGLSVPVSAAPAGLGQRILSQAQREARPLRTKEPSGGFLRRLTFGWPAAATALGAVSVIAILFSASLKMEVDDLQQENNDLQANVQAATFRLDQEIRDADSRLEEQQIVTSVMSDDQKQELDVTSSEEPQASASYTWSPDSRLAVIQCSDLPDLPPGKIYQVWVRAGANVYPVATVVPENGWCQVALDLSFLRDTAAGIGLTVENLPGGIEAPTEWLLYAHLP
jgi:hypothetical protein